jgi:hypothetical protein
MHAAPWERISALVIHFRVRPVVRQLDQQANVLAQLFDVRAVLCQCRACLLNSEVMLLAQKHGRRDGTGLLELVKRELAQP